jgi:uncharacterized alpha-E superfamily protein
MLNRNAEALFWVGRYMERAENHARLIDVHYHMHPDGGERSGELRWSRLVGALGARNEYLQHWKTFMEREVLTFITLDRGYSNSLYSCVSQARNNLRTLREILPSELWDVLNGMYLWLSERTAADLSAESPHHFYRQVRERAAQFLGTQQSVMVRGNEWQFMEGGRLLERAENTLRILQSVLWAQEHDHSETYSYWLAVLKSVSGYHAFRKFYADEVKAEPILAFLIGNESFPRSVHFAVGGLEECLLAIDQGENRLNVAKEKIIRQVVRLRAELACLELEDVTAERAGTMLEELSSSCRKIGAAIAEAFFRPEEVSA